MLFSAGQTSKRSLTGYDGPSVRTSEEWLALSKGDRAVFASQMDILGPLNEFIFQRAHNRRSEVETDFCYHCMGKGKIERHPREVGIFSPSGLTRCARETYFQFIGEAGENKNDSVSQRTFDVGTALHEWYQERYLHPMFPETGEAGVVFRSEVSSKDEGISLFGHADGELSGKMFRVGVEIKTMSAKSFAKMTKPSWDYIVQNTGYNRMNCWPGSIFLCIEKDYPHNLAQFFLGFDPDINDWIEERLAGIEQAAELGEPPDPDVDTNWACRRCRFYNICRFGGGEV